MNPDWALGEHENIITVIPERHHGPGWANHTITVLVRNSATNTYRTIWLQPEEMSAELHVLFEVACACHGRLLYEVRRLFGSAVTRGTAACSS